MQLFSLFGEILIKDNGAKEQLEGNDKKASGLSSSMGLSFGSIASAALKLGSILGVGLGIKDMISSASAGEDRLAQLDARLKSTGDASGMTKQKLLDLAAAQGQLTTYSKGANIETENLLLTFTNIGQKTFPQALSAVNDMSTALGQDTKSSAIQLGKALNDPINGITALKRVGVNFTDSQKEQIKTMVQAGDVAGAQGVILQELSKEFGGSAEAAGKTFGGQLTILQNNLRGVGASIGSAVLPYLTQFVSWINSNMPKIQQVVSVVMKGITDAIGTLGSFIKEYLVPIFQVWFSYITANMPKMKQIFDDVMPIIQGLLKGITVFVKDVLVPVFSTMLSWFVENFPKIQAAVMEAWNYIKPHFDTLVQTVKDDVIPMIQGLWDTFQKAMPGIQAICEIVFPIVVGLIGVVIDTITNFIKIVTGIYEAIKPALDLVATLFSDVFGGIKTVIEGVQTVLDIFNGTKIQDKSATATITTNYKTDGTPIGHNASGTDNWRGGLTSINELGGEIVDLPSGSRIIPHDVSMAMASNNSILNDMLGALLNKLDNAGTSISIQNLALPNVDNSQKFIDTLTQYAKTHS